MNNFWPSLQHIAYSRVAKEILYSFDLEHLKNESMDEGFIRTEHIEQIEEKVSTFVLPSFDTTFSRLSLAPTRPKEKKDMILPIEVQKKLTGVVMALFLEVKNWFISHTFILFANNLDLRNRLVWFPFGIIDCFQTARNYVQDDDWNIEERLHLACKYYFEDDVQMLWTCMSFEERFSFQRRHRRIRIIELWLHVLSRNEPLDWEQISRNEMHNFFSDNFLGMRYYFTKLRAPNGRYMCIFCSLGHRCAHHFDLYSCVSLINNDELHEIFTRLPSSELFRFFKCFLQWPFQNIFTDVVNNFQQHFNGDVFHDLVTFISINKVLMGWKDHQYVALLDHIWNLMADKYEDYVKNDTEIYEIVKVLLKIS